MTSEIEKYQQNELNLRQQVKKYQQNLSDIMKKVLVSSSSTSFAELGRTNIRRGSIES
jgi:hypothetical protein